MPQPLHIKSKVNNNWGRGTDDHILPLGISLFHTLMIFNRVLKLLLSCLEKNAIYAPKKSRTTGGISGALTSHLWRYPERPVKPTNCRRKGRLSNVDAPFARPSSLPTFKDNSKAVLSLSLASCLKGRLSLDGDLMFRRARETWISSTPCTMATRSSPSRSWKQSSKLMLQDFLHAPAGNLNR